MKADMSYLIMYLIQGIIFREGFMRPVLSTKMSGDAESVEHKDRGAGKKSTGALWKLMREKALETGVQGVPNIGRARDGVRRVFWILVVFTGTGESTVN